jgi:hypothetical protein
MSLREPKLGMLDGEGDSSADASSRVQRGTVGSLVGQRRLRGASLSGSGGAGYAFSSMSYTRQREEEMRQQRLERRLQLTNDK